MRPLLSLCLLTLLAIAHAGSPTCDAVRPISVASIPSQALALQIHNPDGVAIYTEEGPEWSAKIYASTQTFLSQIDATVAADNTHQTVWVNISSSRATSSASPVLSPSTALTLAVRITNLFAILTHHKLFALSTRSVRFTALACGAALVGSLVPGVHAQTVECDRGILVLTHPPSVSVTRTPSPTTLTVAPTPSPPTGTAASPPSTTISPSTPSLAPSTAPPAPSTSKPPSTAPPSSTTQPPTSPPAPPPTTAKPPPPTPAPTTSKPAPPGTRISTTDNSIADWSSVPGVVSWATDPSNNGVNSTTNAPSPISPSADVLQGYVWADSTYLCVRIRYAGATSFTAIDNLIFLDLDSSLATGYQQSYNTIGAELRWLNGVLYSYAGSGADYVWYAFAGAGTTYQLVGSNYETCVLRSAIGLTSSVQQVRFFIEGVDKRGTPAWQDDVINYYPNPGAYLSFKACDSIGASTLGCANVPTITALSVTPAQPISPASISVTVHSSSAATVNITLQVSLNAGLTWRTMRIDTSLGAVSAAAAGTTYSVGWDATNDLGIRSKSAVIRAVARNSNGIGAAVSKAVTVPHHDIVRAFVRRVDHHATHYGDINAANVALAQAHELVVIHATHINNVNRGVVSQLQQGLDASDPADDPLVLCYISVGEDLRTAYVTNEQLFADPRFRCDGTGPRVDPRGPLASGQSLLNINPLGLPSPGGTGWCSFYLDDNSVILNDTADLGLPDRNKIFGGAFVNAGDPLWFETLRTMTFDSSDAQYGIDELLTTTYGRGLGCDGLFLDTIDTAAPNAYTDGTSPNVSKFEWTAAGFSLFIERLRNAYPDVVILQNRGIFFFSPVLPQFQVTTRGFVDFVLFESFRLNSNNWETYDPVFFPDNRYNYAPKLMAEANRPDGFRVLSLGYAEGPGIEYDTLLSLSGAGYADLLEDVRVSEMEVGFRHYLTSAAVDFLNNFCIVHSNTSLPGSADVIAPIWTATYNPNSWPPAAPLPRVGIQRAISRTGYVEIQWDVALDLNRVHYALYYKSLPFNFVSSNPLSGATRVVMTPGQPKDYAATATTFPYNFNVTGLQLDTLYYFLIRAFDESPNANEESNQVTLSAYALSVNPSAWAYPAPSPMPTTAGPVWQLLNVTHSSTNLQLRFKSYAAFNLDGSPTYGFSRTNFYLDLDDNPVTGYAVSGIGSEVLVQGTTIVRQAAGVFNNGFLGTASAVPTTAITDAVLSIPISLLRTVVPSASRVRVVGQNDELATWIPPAGTFLTNVLP